MAADLAPFVESLSLTDGEEGADALREILTLYDFADSADTRAMIEGLLSVAARRVARAASGRRLLPRHRSHRASRRGPLRRQRRVTSLPPCWSGFLGLYCSLNSFSKLIATTNQGKESCGDGRHERAKLVLL